jgi:hypothetical protein
VSPENVQAYEFVQGWFERKGDTFAMAVPAVPNLAPHHAHPTRMRAHMVQVLALGLLACSVVDEVHLYMHWVGFRTAFAQTSMVVGREGW